MVHFNSTIVFGKIFRSVALMMHLVGATTNREKNYDIIVHIQLPQFSQNSSKFQANVGLIEHY